jgi:cytochrome b6-f complex iron-sulfur subunit
MQFSEPFTDQELCFCDDITSLRGRIQKPLLRGGHMSEVFISRKDFIKQLALLGVGTITVASCIGGCANSSSLTAPTGVNFTLDLTQSANDVLNSVGGVVRRNGIIIVRVSISEFVAVQEACTHEGTALNWNSSSNGFSCPLHGARFTKDGAVTQGPASSNLKKYNTSLDGSSLRVFS